MGMEIKDNSDQSPKPELHVEDHLNVVRTAISRTEEIPDADARACVQDALRGAETVLEEALTDLSTKKATPDH